MDDATAKGAKVIAGGKARPDIGPLFYEPTVLTNVAPEMECAANETFGPVVSIYPVADVDEAVEKANDTDYGLNASVWAGSTAEGQRIAARLRSGTVNVDEGYAFAWGSLSAPMGGMGLSGSAAGTVRRACSSTPNHRRSRPPACSISIRPSASRPQSGRSHCYPSCAP